MEQRRTIVVVGATGGQGRGVVSALLKDDSGSPWSVRAVVRDVNSDRAQKLLADNQTADNRLSIMTGNAYDPETLRRAFSGAYGVFGSTYEVLPGKILVHEEETAHELEAGRNMVDAAKKCGVVHFVFSSLPDMVKATSGRYSKIYHMNNKYITEQYARKELDNVTCLIPGFFYSNLYWSWYSQRRADGVVRFCAPIPGPQAAQWVDSSYDVGVFAARVFALGVGKTKGKNYPVLSPMITMDDMASTFTRVTGQPAVHSPLSHDEWANMTAKMLGPAYREDVKQMMQWASEAPTTKICYGALDPEDDRSAEELGVTASTFEDWLKRTGWTGPSNAN